MSSGLIWAAWWPGYSGESSGLTTTLWTSKRFRSCFHIGACWKCTPDPGTLGHFLAISSLQCPDSCCNWRRGAFEAVLLVWFNATGWLNICEICESCNKLQHLNCNSFAWAQAMMQFEQFFLMIWLANLYSGPEKRLYTVIRNNTINN